MPKSVANTAAARSTQPSCPKRRAADIAYDKIEALISKLVIAPGSPVVEAELAEMTQLGRTPVREALMRMVSIGLVVQQPRRGLIVSSIDVKDHLNVIQTRRVLEQLIASSAARRASHAQRKELLSCAQMMIDAAEHGSLDDYMAADQKIDHVTHEACRNPSAVKAVVPLVVQCRRFWYAHQHEGDIKEAARAHMRIAQSIANGDEEEAVRAAALLMDYLGLFARRVIDT